MLITLQLDYAIFIEAVDRGELSINCRLQITIAWLIESILKFLL